MLMEDRFVSLKEASTWASNYLNRDIKISNISYLIQYGRIKKYGNNKKVLVSLKELKEYYDKTYKVNQQKEENINWILSFAEYSEAERTKHVHRIHPYKGKFIPQLVEYFLDFHTDSFKREVYFKPGDIVLDPFCGSGTTLVQANELGIHAVGVDISQFNVTISNVKVRKHDLVSLASVIKELTLKLENYQNNLNVKSFEEELQNRLTDFNDKYFPSPDFKRWILEGRIKEEEYGSEKEKEFLNIYNELVDKYKIKIKQNSNKMFLDLWYLDIVRKELDFLANEIKNISDQDIKEVLYIILSRTARSCRATTHSDLATLKEPIYTTYYCKKHGKICKPVFTISKWWQYYAYDTLKRLAEFDKLRTDTFQICIAGDSRKIDIFTEVEKQNPKFANVLKKQKIKGIFTSPPYLGLIDYHEQHAYAYEIFGFERKDDLEIGSLSKGTGKQQKTAYIKDIAEVLMNCKKYLQEDYNIFIVANDKYNLYPKIAELAGMKIVNEFKRPVLCRVEKNRDQLYSESIFHFKEK
jgi:Predicted DNA modification methylase